MRVQFPAAHQSRCARAVRGIESIPACRIAVRENEEQSHASGPLAPIR